MAAKIDTKTEGLDIYVHVARTFADTPWLHYGLWEKGERPTMPKLRMAQERYVDRLLALIPAGASSILDIGGGTGEMARLLTGRGHGVDMITPSALQAEIAREKLGGEGRVFQTTFEAFDGEGPYAVCLFSESFQYVRLDESLEKLETLLAPDGVAVIADCFRSADYKGDRKPGGGHAYPEFLAALERAGLAVASDEDVTEMAAPSIALDQAFYRDVAGPVVEQARGLFERRRPMLYRLARWLYRAFVPAAERENIVARLKADYRSPEAFVEANTYRFLTLRRARG